jgi:hypothetical protein
MGLSDVTFVHAEHQRRGALAESSRAVAVERIGQPVDPATATGKTKEIFDTIEHRLKRVPGMSLESGTNVSIFVSVSAASTSPAISPSNTRVMSSAVEATSRGAHQPG